MTSAIKTATYSMIRSLLHFLLSTISARIHCHKLATVIKVLPQCLLFGLVGVGSLQGIVRNLLCFGGQVIRLGRVDPVHFKGLACILTPLTRPSTFYPTSPPIPVTHPYPIPGSAYSAHYTSSPRKSHPKNSSSSHHN